MKGHRLPMTHRQPRGWCVWWLPLSNQLFDYHCYHQKCLLELQFNLIYYQCPKNPGPHISPPGATSPSPRIATAGLVHTAPHSPALPHASTKAHSPDWAPISRNVPDAKAWGCPQLSPSGLCSPGRLPSPVLRKQPLLQCLAVYVLNCILNCLDSQLGFLLALVKVF